MGWDLEHGDCGHGTVAWAPGNCIAPASFHARNQDSRAIAIARGPPVPARGHARGAGAVYVQPW